MLREKRRKLAFRISWLIFKIYQLLRMSFKCPKMTILVWPSQVLVWFSHKRFYYFISQRIFKSFANKMENRRLVRRSFKIRSREVLGASWNANVSKVSFLGCFEKSDKKYILWRRFYSCNLLSIPSFQEVLQWCAAKALKCSLQNDTIRT